MVLSYILVGCPCCKESLDTCQWDVIFHSRGPALVFVKALWVGTPPVLGKEKKGEILQPPPPTQHREPHSSLSPPPKGVERGIIFQTNESSNFLSSHLKLFMDRLLLKIRFNALTSKLLYSCCALLAGRAGVFSISRTGYQF